MNKIHIAAMISLGLALGFVSCQASSNDEVAPASTEAPSGLQTAKYHFDAGRPL